MGTRSVETAAMHEAARHHHAIINSLVQLSWLGVRPTAWSVRDGKTLVLAFIRRSYRPGGHQLVPPSYGAPAIARRLGTRL